MDYFVRKEINGLKQDIIAKEAAVEAYKYDYERQILNGLGEQMKKELKNPSKLSWWEVIKLKYARWRKIKQEEREIKRLQKDIKDNNYGDFN
jgi:hypothetical protein